MPIATLRRLFRLPMLDAARARRAVDDEIAFHLAERMDDLVAHGHAPAEAAARAHAEFGDVREARDALAGDAVRDARADRLRLHASDLLDDLRHAARALRRAPGFAAVVVLTLALGLGANAAMIDLLDRLLLRAPAGVADAERVVRIYGRNGWTALTRAWPDYLDLRGTAGRVGARTLSHVAAYRVFTTEGRADEVGQLGMLRVSAATPGYFATLGVRAAHGRTFAEDEAGTDAPSAAVAVISDRLWARAFRRDASALGRTIRVGRAAVRVVGVAPPGFRGVDVEPVDVWTPLAAPDADRGNYGAVHVVARLAPGVAMSDADREANRVNRRGIAADGLVEDEDRMQLGALALTQGPAAPKEIRVARWLGAVAALVLLVAVANVAHLLLARGLAQARETAVRAALGAGRGRLARQWIAQGLILAALGGAAALLVARLLAPALLRLVLPDAEPPDWLADDGAWRALAPTLLLTLAAGLLAGLAPAVQASRGDLAAALRGASPSDRARSRTHAHVRGLLLVTQVACTAALLVGAGLLVRSLGAVRALDLGFDAERLVVVNLREAAEGGATLDAAAAAALLGRLAERARGVPGVEAASVTHTVPFHSAWRTRFYVPGRDPERWGRDGGGRFNFLSTFVDTAFRATTGLQLVAGRWLDARDAAHAPPVAIVNERFAAEVWPAASREASLAAALGQCVHVMAPDAPCTRVVGIVRPTRVESVFDEAPAQYFLALAQPRREETGASLLVRVADDGAEGAVAAIEQRLRDLAPGGVNVHVAPLSAAFEPVRQPWVLGARVLSLFAGLVLFVALMGVYGLVTLMVAERTAELGLRRALGARPADLASLLARRVLPLLGAGLALGLAAGWAGARAASALLYGVGPLDAPTYASVAAGFLGVALLACAGPLCRAIRVSPLTALRGAG